MNVNELNNAWIASGQKVEDLNAKINNALMDDDFSQDDFKALKDSRDQEVARRDGLKDAVANARAQEALATDPKKKPLDQAGKDLKDTFIKDFKDMVLGKPEILNQVNSDTDESGNRIGLTIPADVQTTIHKLVRQYDSLEQYVSVEKVTTSNGSRVLEKWSDVTPLANLDTEDAEIGDNDDPQLTLIKYLIKRYAGITTITNTLLKDTAENIMAWLSSWIAKKVVVTRNQAVIAALATLPGKPTIAKFDDIKDLQLTAVDPAIQATSMFLTNTSGFAAIAKVKDKDGQYLVQPDVTNPEIYRIGGKAVHVVADRWLPDVKGAHPLYFGDLKQAVTLFDREQMSLLTTNIGAGAFEKDLTKIRVIDRFDVVTTDAEAFVAGSFKAIEDQGATSTTTASTGA